MTRYTILTTHPDTGDLWIAGRRIPRGETTVELTEAEAAYDLRQGSIAPADGAAPQPATGAALAGDTGEPASGATANRRGR